MALLIIYRDRAFRKFLRYNFSSYVLFSSFKEVVHYKFKIVTLTIILLKWMFGLLFIVNLGEGFALMFYDLKLGLINFIPP